MYIKIIDTKITKKQIEDIEKFYNECLLDDCCYSTITDVLSMLEIEWINKKDKENV